MQVIHLGPDRWSMIGEGLGTGISQGLTQKLQQMDQQRMERERIERESRDLTQMMRAMQEAQEPRIEQRHLSPQETRGVQQQAMQRGLLPRMAQMTGEGAGTGLAPGHPGGVPTHLQQAVAPSQQEVMDRFTQQYTPRTETGLSMLQQMMQQQMQPPEPVDPVKMRPGERLVHPETGDVVTQVPERGEVVEMVRNGQTTKARRGTPTYQQLLDMGFSDIKPSEAERDMRMFERITGRTPGEHEKLDMLGLAPADRRGEAERIVDDLVRMEEEGEKDTQRYSMLAQRFGKLTEESPGMAMRFDPETGEWIMIEGVGAGEALADQMTASQREGRQAQLDRWDNIIDTIDTSIEMVEERPTDAGTLGGIKHFMQRLTGVGRDVGGERIANIALDSLGRFRDQDGRPIPPDQRESLAGFFDPRLHELEIYQNTIALELAKLRVLSGGSSIRAIESAFKRARSDAAILPTDERRLFTGEEALTRLRAIKEEFLREREALGKRLHGTEHDQMHSPYEPTEEDMELLERYR